MYRAQRSDIRGDCVRRATTPAGRRVETREEEIGATGRFSGALVVALVCVGALLLGAREASAVLADLAADAYTTAGSRTYHGAANTLRIAGLPASGRVQKTF